jgi:hypothetical protein
MNGTIALSRADRRPPLNISTAARAQLQRFGDTMSNTERSAPLAPESARFSNARRIPLQTEASPAREPAQAGGAPHNPFASFAPPEAGASRDTNAETKLYEVPRELIEIARARANGAERAGKTTPLAPRPDAELEATLRAYTARLSTQPPRVPSLLLDVPIGRGVAAEPSELLEVERDARGKQDAVRTAAPELAAEQTTAELAIAAGPEPALPERRPLSPHTLERRAAVRGSALRGRDARLSNESRAWMVYTALSLMGLASCAHVLLAP